MDIEDPENTLKSLTITMSKENWKLLQKQLKNEWPSKKINWHISNTIFNQDKKETECEEKY